MSAKKPFNSLCDFYALIQLITLFIYFWMNPSEINRNFSPRIKIKTFTHDYYMLQLPQNMADPFYRQFPFYAEETDFRGSPIKMAPVARIYGTNQFGQKCCCHIHGYFPHFYIKALDYSEAFSKNAVFLSEFLSTLENLYQRAYQVNKPIILKGYTEEKYDFYGYHESQQCFLKLILYDPAYIPKMRELLDSKILCNRTFQCYEAHINYFMQLFSDQNIYGINQMSIFGYTFRKNMNSDIMQLFKKIALETGALNEEGWDLIQLQRQYPDAFNSLHKNSTCYIQIDFHINAILNSFEAELEEEEMRSSDEEDNIEQPHKRKFKVKITKALEQIWTDERRRRSHFGISARPRGEIDFSKNIQAHYSVYEKDPLWINFISKSNNAQLFADMIRSSIKGAVPHQTQQIRISRNIAQNYNNVLREEKQQLIQRVNQRWKYYGKRKVNILNQLLEGDRDQLPQWDDAEAQSSGQSESNESSHSKQLDQNLLSKEEENLSIKKKPGNTILYRANFKHVKANLRKDSYFYICDYCKKKSKNCTCKQVQQFDQKDIKTTLKARYKTVQKITENNQFFQFSEAAPTIRQCLQTIQIQSQKPFYSNFEDLLSYYKIGPQFENCLKTVQFLEKELKVIEDYERQPITIKNQLRLPDFFIIDQQPQNQNFNPCTYTFEFQEPPPTHADIQKELLSDKLSSQQNLPKMRRSTSVGPMKNPSFISDLLVIHYELICDIINPKFHYANPESDPIVCLVYDIANFKKYDFRVKGMILVEKYFTNFDMLEIDDLFVVKDEQALLTIFINIVFRIDPDLLISYDQEKKGIRYMTQRGFNWGMNLQQLLSRTGDLQQLFSYINFRDFRMPKETYLTRKLLLSGNLLENKRRHINSNQLKFLQQKMKRNLKKKPILRKSYRFDVDIRGRVNLNIYRICESDLKLKSYTLQAVTKHLFNEQLCQFTDAQLFQWLKQSNKTAQFVLQYLQTRLALQSRIIITLNILSVVIQKSKIFGADFISMMERGSQFKIETVMCRVTKKSGYLTLSASKKQVANQSILECWPLVIEPPKQFYSDPVLLFDFQSLYPSVMIAYNLCYSTCLGSISNLFDENKNKRFGVCESTNIDVGWLQQVLNKCEKEEILQIMQRYIFITPNKVAFVKKNVKEGIIPRILLEFLISRIMIKDSSSLYSKQKIKGLLKNRQIALKLFMNVMFGYTGASFSGRMPCSEIADSVVEVAKYSLRQAIDFLNSHPKYKGKVLYGDTDSVFFHLPGYSIKQAIDIGNQLAEKMTSLFPYPMEMKFEKVYDGLFLVSKKRYYGKSYESHNSGPKYEGKGLECVRRDGIELTSNLMKKTLNNIIDTKDLSTTKIQFLKECGLILGEERLQDQFALAKEVKLIKYTEKYIPGHGQAARRLEKIDPMIVPKYGERMKYFVIQGGLKAVRNRSIAVFQFAMNKNMKLDYQYYLNKQVIPPLQRVLSSLVNFKQWYVKNSEMRAVQKRQESLNLNKKCLKCSGQTYFAICEKCFPFVEQQIQKLERETENEANKCKECICDNLIDQDRCVQWNCPQLWRRRRMNEKLRNIKPELQKLQQALQQISF